MQIVIEGAEGLQAGYYGTWTRLDDGGTLHLVVDTDLDPDECAYPVTVGQPRY